MVFKGLSIHIVGFHSQSRTGGRGLICETKIPGQELWLKWERGLFARGGIFAGHYDVQCHVESSPIIIESVARLYK